MSDPLNGARWVLHHGDNREILPTLGDGSVAHVITDPPYEAAAHTLGRRIKVGHDRDGDSYGTAALLPLDFSPISDSEREQVGAEIARVVRRWVMAFCQVEATQKWADSFRGGALDYVRTGIWVKPDGQPQLSGDRPGMGYESIVFAHPKGRKRWNGGGRLGVFTLSKQQDGGGPPPHPTTKPLPLMMELVELLTDPGDIVLDPFAGSGTTGVACLRLGRRFIGIEKSEAYAAIATERLKAEERGLSLREARAGQTTFSDLLGT